MLSSRDDQDLGPLVQAQYVRLKVDMQITEEKNQRLRQQLYDRENLLFLLADGQKEVAIFIRIMLIFYLTPL